MTVKKLFVMASALIALSILPAACATSATNRSKPTVFSPAMIPPTNSPTRLPVILTYNTAIGPLLQQKCSACHDAAATDGLILTTYAGAMQGATDGPIIIPGKPNDSKLVEILAAGGHPGQLRPDELAQIVRWITSGAPEK